MDALPLRIALASLLGLFASGCETSRTPPAAQAPSPSDSQASSTTGPRLATSTHATSPKPDASTAPGKPATIAADRVFIRVTRQNGGLEARGPKARAARPFRQVIVAIRGDGKAVWSESTKGDGPLRTGSVGRERLDQWIADLRSAGTLTAPAMKSHFGPDATTVEIDIDLGDQKLKVASWHGMVDATRHIALERGIVSLEGRNPAEVLAKEPPEYRRFLANWASLRTSIRALLPASSKVLPKGKSANDVLGAR